MALLFSVGCRHAPTQPSDTSFALSVEDVSCTEVFLQLQLGSGIASRQVTLKRDTVVVFAGTVMATQSILTDSILLPNHLYSYTASVGGNNQSCTATTMDTTSHAFSFTTTYLGGGAGSSYLLDVAIISDTLAYAVGTIFQAGIPMYNASIWNGNSWTPKAISVNFRGTIDTLPLSGVYPFSATDLWCVGSLPIHGDGQNWIVYDVRSMPGLESLSLEKAWGVSSTDMYFVGNAGSIAHFDGTTWTKIQSGTSLDMLDIHGAGDEILAVASDNNPLGETIVSISGNSSTQISSVPLGQHQLNGVWFVPNRHYYVVGDGIYEKHLLSDGGWENGPTDITHYGTTKVAGNGLNDVIVVGAFGEFLHWNGVSWKSYLAQTGIAGAYSGLAVHGNTVIAVGEANGLAVITIGRR